MARLRGAITKLSAPSAGAWLDAARELLDITSSAATDDTGDHASALPAAESLVLGLALVAVRDARASSRACHARDREVSTGTIAARLGDISEWLFGDAGDPFGWRSGNTAAIVEHASADRIARLLDARAACEGDSTGELLARVLEDVILPARSTAPQAVGRGRGASRWVTRRRTTGSYYTPPEVARFIAREALAPRDGAALDRWVEGDVPVVLDPACGGGALLLAALTELGRQARRLAERAGVDDAEASRLADRVLAAAVRRGRLRGADVLPEALAVTQARLALAVGAGEGDAHALVPAHAFCAVDVLDVEPAVLLGGFDGVDAVVGNPPFGLRTGARERLFPGDRGQASDSYAMFLALGARLLAPGGVMAMVTADTWHTIRRHTALRQRLLAKCRPRLAVLLPPGTFRQTVSTSIVVLERRGGATDGAVNGDAYRAIDATRFVPAGDDEKNPLALFDVALSQALVCDGIDGSLPPPAGLVVHDVPTARVAAIPWRPIVAVRPSLARFFEYPSELVVRYGDAVVVKQGLATGDNEHYLYVVQDETRPDDNGNGQRARMRYRVADPVRCLRVEELVALTADEREDGIDPARHGGRYLVPYDKGEPATVQHGWLPQFFSPVRTYFDYSREAVARLRTYTIGERRRRRGEPGIADTRVAARLQNQAYYFREGLTFSWTGMYSPTFRRHAPVPFDHASSCVFLPEDDDEGTRRVSPTIDEHLAVLCSTVARFLMRGFINHTVNFGVDDLKHFPMIRADVLADRAPSAADLVSVIAGELSAAHAEGRTPPYPVLCERVRELDAMVARAYGLARSEIQDVEAWFAHRYPALAAARGAG